MNPQKNRKRKKSKIRSGHISKTVALLVLFCLCIGGISLVSAKYIQQTVTNNNSATAKEFYFESDLLDGTVHEVVPTDSAENGGKTASVTIRLKNYADELRYSEVPIIYTVSVKEGTSGNRASEDEAPGNEALDNGTSENSAAGNDTSNIQITYPSSSDAENGQHTIAAGAKNNADVTLSNLQAGHTYTVTAVTSNTYQKTLTGTIKVTQPDTKVYASLSDKTQYIEVTVWTTDYTGSVTLNYCAELIPDNTDVKMADAKTVGTTAGDTTTGDTTTEGSITDSNWGANTSHVFRFFKSNTNKKYQVTVNNENKGVTVSAVQ